MTSRKGYRKLTQAPAWGVYRRGKLVGTCRAASGQEAMGVFVSHNLRQPDFKITGDELKRIF